MWPEGEDFIQLVGTAVKDRRSLTASQLRDALAKPDVVHDTVDALEIIVERIDERIAGLGADDDALRRCERARRIHHDWLVWFRAAAGLVES